MSSTLSVRRHVIAILPGLALLVALSVVARAATIVLPAMIGEVTVGLVLGLILGNVVALPAVTRQGLQFGARTLLRVGIVLLGARLSFAAVVETGVSALAVIAVGMVVAFLVTFAGSRAVGAPHRLAILIGVGTAVCGNSAIAATAPVIQAEAKHVSFAIATITVLGTAAVLLYPLVGHAFAMSDTLFGYWTGVAVNDTSQVTATGFAYSQGAGETATIVKLTRNSLMGPLIVAIGVIHARRSSQPATAASPRPSATTLVPPFVVGFLVLALANSLGALPTAVADAAQRASSVLILMALIGVGATTSLQTLRSVGAAPFYVGLAAAVALSVVGLAVSVFLVG